MSASFLAESMRVESHRKNSTCSLRIKSIGVIEKISAHARRIVLKQEQSEDLLGVPPVLDNTHEASFYERGFQRGARAARADMARRLWGALGEHPLKNSDLVEIIFRVEALRNTPQILREEEALEQEQRQPLPAHIQAFPRYTAWYRLYRDGYYTHFTKAHLPGKGRPLVTVCVLTDTATSRQYVGYSICSPRDTPDRRRGRYIARARAEMALTRGIPFHVYKQGLGKAPRRVLAACGLCRCVYPATEEAGDWLCIPLRCVDGDPSEKIAP